MDKSAEYALLASTKGIIFWIYFCKQFWDFTEHDYQFEVDSAPVASVHKKWVKLQDQIDISMTGEVDLRVIIGAVIVIE